MASRTPENTENQCPFHAERSGEVREVGSHAVWSLSSCKPGKIIFGLKLFNYELNSNDFKGLVLSS
jgi:hypothetical protein